MTTGKEAMRHLQRVRPGQLDDVDSKLDWETIVAQPRGHTSSSPGRRVLKWGLAGAVPIVAAAIALVLVGRQPPTPAPSEQRHATAPTSRELLLVAATNALKTKSTGRY